jgi:large subunit ribosomal protein L3
MDTVGMSGKKMRMTQIKIGEELIGSTPVGVGGNIISQVKTKEGDGYIACQIGFGNCAEKRLTRPLLKRLKKLNITPRKYFREIRNMSGFEVGSPVEPTIFKEKETIKVSGISKGKGTAGVIKRHHFGRGRMSHGGGPVHRHGGSSGGGRGTRQKVSKGKKMPGRMGNEKVTQKSVIEKIDLNHQIIYIRGGIPGPIGGLVTLKKV